jgi:hypothetical protein
MCLPCFVPAKRSGVSTATAEANNKSNVSTPTASITGVDAVALQGTKNLCVSAPSEANSCFTELVKHIVGLNPGTGFIIHDPVGDQGKYRNRAIG